MQIVIKKKVKIDRKKYLFFLILFFNDLKLCKIVK